MQHLLVLHACGAVMCMQCSSRCDVLISGGCILYRREHRAHVVREPGHRAANLLPGLSAPPASSLCRQARPRVAQGSVLVLRVVALTARVAAEQVQRWESLHARQCGAPRLKRFMGRPNEYSPKARLLNLLGYKLPFDRHDWVVDRCGRDVRCAAACSQPSHAFSCLTLFLQRCLAM